MQVTDRDVEVLGWVADLALPAGIALGPVLQAAAHHCNEHEATRHQREVGAARRARVQAERRMGRLVLPTPADRTVLGLRLDGRVPGWQVRRAGRAFVAPPADAWGRQTLVLAETRRGKTVTALALATELLRIGWTSAGSTARPIRTPASPSSPPPRPPASPPIAARRSRSTAGEADPTRSSTVSSPPRSSPRLVRAARGDRSVVRQPRLSPCPAGKRPCGACAPDQGSRRPTAPAGSTEPPVVHGSTGVGVGCQTRQVDKAEPDAMFPWWAAVADDDPDAAHKRALAWLEDRTRRRQPKFSSLKRLAPQGCASAVPPGPRE